MTHTKDGKYSKTDDDILMYKELEDELDTETNLECEHQQKFSKSKNYIIAIFFILICFNFLQIFFMKIELNDLKLKFNEISKIIEKPASHEVDKSTFKFKNFKVDVFS